MTNTGADVQDLFVVPNASALSLLNLSMTTRTEVFEVAHGATVSKEVSDDDRLVDCFVDKDHGLDLI